MKRLLPILLLLVMVAGLILGGCSPSPAPTATTTPPPVAYKIGYVAPLSGWGADLGTDRNNGAQYAVEQANKAGGINGHPVELIVYDDESDPAKGVLAAKKLIDQDNVLAFASGGVGPLAFGLKPLADESKIVHLSGDASVFMIANTTWGFKVIPSEGAYCLASLEIARRNEAKNLAFIRQDGAWGESYMPYYKKYAAELGYNIVAEETFNPGDVDMTAQLVKIKAANPDILLVIDIGVEGILAIEQAKAMGMTIPMEVHTAEINPPILEAKAQALEGCYVTFVWSNFPDGMPQDDPQIPVIRAFQAGMAVKLGHPQFGDEKSGYDQMLILMEALRIANPDTSKLAEARAQIRDAMEKVQVVGADNIYKYSADNHEGVMNRGVIAQIKDGKEVPVVFLPAGYPYKDFLYTVPDIILE